jgi:FMN reductase
MNTKTPYIVALGGTVRKASRTRAACMAALQIAQDRGAQTEMLDLGELDLPLFVPDFDIDDYTPQHRAALQRFVDASRKATALIWCSPTYHGTVSGIFKNAVDFYELISDDEPSYLSHKAVGLIAVSDSKTFGAMANSVHELRAWLAPSHITLSSTDFDEQMRLVSERGIKRVTRLVDELIAWK